MIEMTYDEFVKSLERYSKILPTATTDDMNISLVDALVLTKLAKSKSDARRLIKQGAISYLKIVYVPDEEKKEEKADQTALTD